MGNFWYKKFRALAILLLCLMLTACDQGAQGCIDPAEFLGGISAKIEGEGYNAAGDYDHQVGGQISSWQETGFRYDGGVMLLKISGAIGPWGASSGIDVFNMPKCKMCARASESEPCRCYDNPDLNAPGCSTQHGSVEEANVYHFPLNRISKDRTLMIPDDQYACRYSQGLNGYIGLFGHSGYNSPTRLYHLFSQEAVCDIDLDENGRCVLEDGRDVTQYLYRSPNDAPFVKSDDGNGNIQYHKKGEYIKVIFYDRYYSDNEGQYNIEFLSGVAGSIKPGLLESLVQVVEDVLLGEPDEETGERPGGILKELYSNLVTDSGFADGVRAALTVYVMIFGVAVLMGVVSMSRKEISSRIIKIALIIMFISPTSWNVYNEYVVKFFKDGMDSVVAMVMNVTHEGRDYTTTMTVCQNQTNQSDSSATRFSCPDMTIKKLFSDPVTKKIFSLLLNSAFGLFYIIFIYALIGFFIFIMLFAASVYIVNLIKIIFALSLGPIFMCLSLFKSTGSMFNNWIKFLVGRAVEIIVLFTTLYLFWSILDKGFSNLLYYEACYIDIYLIKPILKMKVLQANLDRTFIEWMVMIVKLAALMYFTHLIFQQMGKFASNLAAYGGAVASGGKNDPGQDAGASGFSLAGKMAEAARDGAMKSMGVAYSGSKIAGSFGISKARSMARKMGIGKAMVSMGRRLPVRAPGTRIIDTAINSAKAAAKQKGLTGAAADKFIRQETFKNLAKQKQGGRKVEGKGNSFRTWGVDSQNIETRLDQRLIEDPMKNKMKEIAQKLKQADPDKLLLGKEMRNKVNSDVKDWAKKNLHNVDDKQLNKYLKDMRGSIRKESSISTNEAAKKFAGDTALKSKYMQSLQSEQYDKKMKKQDAKDKGVASYAMNQVKTGLQSVGRNAANNPKLAQENFMRKVARKEDNSSGIAFMLNRVKDVANTAIAARNILPGRADYFKRSEKANAGKFNPLRYSNVTDKTSRDIGRVLVQNRVKDTANMAIAASNWVAGTKFEKFEKTGFRQDLGFDKTQRQARLDFINKGPAKGMSAEEKREYDNKRRNYLQKIIKEDVRFDNREISKQKLIDSAKTGFKYVRNLGQKDIKADNKKIDKLLQGDNKKLGSKALTTGKKQLMSEAKKNFTEARDKTLAERALRLSNVNKKLKQDDAKFLEKVAKVQSQKAREESDEIMKKFEALKNNPEELQTNRSNLIEGLQKVKESNNILSDNLDQKQLEEIAKEAEKIKLEEAQNDSDIEKSNDAALDMNIQDQEEISDKIKTIEDYTTSNFDDKKDDKKTVTEVDDQSGKWRADAEKQQSQKDEAEKKRQEESRKEQEKKALQTELNYKKKQLADLERDPGNNKQEIDALKGGIAKLQSQIDKE